MARLKLTTLLIAGTLISFTPAYAAGSGSSGGGGGGGGISGNDTIAATRYDPVVEYQAGVQYLRASDFKNAEKRFARVLSAVSRHPQANYNMGLSKVGQDKHKSAARYFKSAVSADENFFEAYGALGTAYVNAGKEKKAQKVLTKLESRALECGTCNNAPKIKSAQDKINRALSGGVEETAFLAPFGPETADNQYFASVSLINNGQYQAAFEDLKATSAAAGPHPNITTYMGYTQRKLGNYDVAKSYYAMALAVDPNHRGANEYLGELYVETGEMDKAKTQLAKLEEICTFGCIEENELRGWIFDAAP